LGLLLFHVEHSVGPAFCWARVSVPAVAEPCPVHPGHPDAYRPEPNVSDASDDVRPDAAEVAPQAHLSRPSFLADVDAGKLAVPAPDVPVQVVHPGCPSDAARSLPEETADGLAPCIPGAVPSAEQSNDVAALAVPVSSRVCARLHGSPKLPVRAVEPPLVAAFQVSRLPVPLLPRRAARPRPEVAELRCVEPVAVAA